MTDSSILNRPVQQSEPNGLLIGGVWVKRPAVFEVRNPLSEQVVATVCAGNEDDIRDAVAAAGREGIRFALRLT